MGYLSPPPMPAPVVVYKDVGGLVTDYQAQTEQYRRENREVRLHECRSACTLALSLPNVCVYPDAKVKFHQAYNAITKEVDNGVSGELWASYPAPVRARLGYLTREYRVLSGVELIALGMRNCNGDKDGVMIASRRERGATRLASAAPAVQPPGALGDIASRVQTAVASAFTGTPEQPAPPIRIAIPARLIATPTAPVAPLPPMRPDFAEGAVSIASAETNGQYAPNAPLPPRRPPSRDFTNADARVDLARAEPAPDEKPLAIASADDPLAYRQLMNGAQPILSRDFVRAMAAQ